MLPKLICFVALALAVALPGRAGGHSEPSPAAPGYPLDIVATSGMIGDVVARVAGSHATVHVLMGEEVDPHLYRPTRADIARMQRADVIFYNGLLLEGRIGDTLAQLGHSRPVHAVAELIDAGFLLDDEDEEAYDPHLWMDVSLWILAVDVVESQLSRLDPQRADDYRTNASTYQAELERLDDYVRRIVLTIPESSRILVTAHDAFGYFGRAYGLEVLAVQGLSTESEAGLDDINALVRTLVDRRIAAVFAETTVPPRALAAVIEGAAARGHRVEMGGELYSDAMGPSGTWEGTYIGMIDHNATTIVRALGGTAPTGGFAGRLTPAERR